MAGRDHRAQREKHKKFFRSRLLNIQIGFECWIPKVPFKRWSTGHCIFYVNHLFVKHEQAHAIKSRKKNNTKQWFDKHRNEYEENVLFPLREFVVTMGERLRKIAPAVNAIPKVNQSLFRINRDTRFSKDKSPYKTCMWIFVAEPCISLRIWQSGPNRDLAGKRGHCCFPFLVVQRLAGAEIDSQRAKIGRAGFLGSTAEDVCPPRDLEVYKTGGHDRGLKLCFRQSTGDSTRP